MNYPKPFTNSRPGVPDKLFLSIIGIAYVGFLIILLPDFVIFRSDDFGYYQSVVSSLREGVIIRSDWLEPLNFPLTLTSFILYKITHQFYLSTIGTNVLFSAISLFSLIWIFKRFMNLYRASLWALVVMTFPIILNKTLDYTGAILSMSLFLVALNLYFKKRWVLFYLMTFLAIINRQSAVILLILPAYNFINDYIKLRKINWQLIILTLLLAFSTLIIIHYTNVTYAQKNITNKLFENLDIVNFIVTFFKICHVTIIILFLIQLFLTRSYHYKENIKHSGFFLVASLLLLIPFILSPNQLVSINAPGLGTLVQKLHLSILFYLTGLIFLWGIDRTIFLKALKNEFFITSICYSLLLSLKGILWDYYLFELGVLLFLFLASNFANAEPKSIDRIIISGLIIINVFFAYGFKIYTDSIQVKSKIYESLLRNNIIQIDQAGGAPWAFIGWKLNNYYINHDGRDFNGLTGFLCYLSNKSVYVDIDLRFLNIAELFISKSPGNPSYNQIPIKNGSGRIGFIPYAATVKLIVSDRSPYPKCDKMGMAFNLDKDYVSVQMPLTNAEWIQFINNP